MPKPDTLLQSRYLILHQVGKGGMGAVYKAKDIRLQNIVALKKTLLVNKSQRKNFAREARLLARLRHSALPKVSDHFFEDDGQFLVMEFIPGDDMAGLMERNGGKFPSDDVVSWILRWADQLLDALEYLHMQSPPVIHRDIKPQNLKLTSRGDIILLDFGLAHSGRSQMTTLTAQESLELAGYTPNYAPLEQIRGADPDPRSDLYSLAATLYHLATGVRPPDSLTRAAALLNKQPDPLQPARAINPRIPRPLSDMLNLAMSLNLSDRPESAAMMRRALRDVSRMLRPATAPLAETDEAESAISPSDEAAGMSPIPFAAADTEQIGLPVGTLRGAISTGTPILTIDLHPKGHLLAVGGEDRTVGLWKIPETTGGRSNPSLIRSLEINARSVRSLAFSPDGRLLIAGNEDKSIWVWRANDGQLIASPDAWMYPTEYVAFRSDGELLVTGGWGSTICLWRIQDDNNLAKHATLATSFVQSLAFNPDGTLLAAGCYDGTVRIWKVADGKPLRSLEGHGNFVLTVGFSLDGERLFSGSGSTIYEWQVSSGRLLDTLHGHTNFVRDLAFSPDGETLASASEDRTARLWRISDTALIHSIDEHTAGVTGVAFTPNGKTLISGSRDKKVRLWQC